MKNYFKNIDKRFLEIIERIASEADRQGISAYIVGGIVRDIIFGRKNFDLDIVVEKDAIVLAKNIGKARKAIVKVYTQFGTATVLLSSGVRVDFSSARKELYSYPGALPRVQKGSLRDDLFRRDFTINAMAICINSKCFGLLVDEFGGLADLHDQKIRVLHESSFKDDPTRIFRAVRFEQRLGFHIEPRTLHLLKEVLRTNLIDNVKSPRYFAEFKKMLSEEKPVDHIKRLSELGALRLMDRVWPADVGLIDQIQRHWRLLPRRLTKLYAETRWLIYFMANAEMFDGSQLSRILGKFPLKKEEKESILQVPVTRLLLRQLGVAGLSRSEIYRILKPLSVEMVVYLRLRASTRNVRERIDFYLMRNVNIRLDINGGDLTRMGIEPGKQIGKILSEILYKKIDGKLKGRKSQLIQALFAAKVQAKLGINRG